MRTRTLIRRRWRSPTSSQARSSRSRADRDWIGTARTIYTSLKSQLQNDANFRFATPVSVFGQWGAPTTRAILLAVGGEGGRRAPNGIRVPRWSLSKPHLDDLKKAGKSKSDR